MENEVEIEAKHLRHCKNAYFDMNTKLINILGDSMIKVDPKTFIKQVCDNLNSIFKDGINRIQKINGSVYVNVCDYCLENHWLKEKKGVWIPVTIDPVPWLNEFKIEKIDYETLDDDDWRLV